jgi:hypothetical protein
MVIIWLTTPQAADPAGLATGKAPDSLKGRLREKNRAQDGFEFDEYKEKHCLQNLSRFLCTPVCTYKMVFCAYKSLFCGYKYQIWGYKYRVCGHNGYCSAYVPSSRLISDDFSALMTKRLNNISRSMKRAYRPLTHSERVTGGCYAYRIHKHYRLQGRGPLGYYGKKRHDWKISRTYLGHGGKIPEEKYF